MKRKNDFTDLSISKNIYLANKKSKQNYILYNKDFILKLVKINGLALQYASEELKNDQNIVLQAIKNNGYALQYASEELKNDQNIVLQAIYKNIKAMEFISEELKHDQDFIISCIIINKYIMIKNNNELYLLIHNLEHNFNTKYIILNKLFLDNIKYISKTKNFYYILNFILKNYLKIFLNNYEKFLNYIIYKLEYIHICQNYNIYIFNIDKITCYGKYNFNDIKKKYEFKYRDKFIIWY